MIYNFCEDGFGKFLGFEGVVLNVFCNVYINVDFYDEFDIIFVLCIFFKCFYGFVFVVICLRI